MKSRKPVGEKNKHPCTEDGSMDSYIPAEFPPTSQDLLGVYIHIYIYIYMGSHRCRSGLYLHLA